MPPPPPAAPPGAGWVETTIAALFDPEVKEVNVESGRTPLIRRGGSWQPAGDVIVGGAEWSQFWAAYCSRTGTDPSSNGYVTRLIDNSVTVEALLPPVAPEPSFVARRRPPALTLKTMSGAGLLDDSQLTELQGAVQARQGILVVGDPRSGLTAVLEAIVDAMPGAERVALVEPRPQVRFSTPSVLRLRSAGGQGQAAMDIAITTSPEWVVIDDALPEAAGMAAWRYSAGGPTCILAARTPDAGSWRRMAAGSIAPSVGGAEIAEGLVARAFPITVTVAPDGDGFRVVSVGKG
jgi:hypothetical protein